jgi:septation ring formation regulator EzrA
MPTKKGKRLMDVLDEKFNLTETNIYNKFRRLHKMMEATNPDIDNVELRWVEHRIELMDDNDYDWKVTKKDLETANFYWKKWNINNRSSK